MGIVNFWGGRRSDRRSNERKAEFTPGMQRGLDQILVEFQKYEKFAATQCADVPRAKRGLYEKWNLLIEEIDRFCEAWVQKENLRTTFARAQSVMAAYYENGKILDYLERINRYIDGLLDAEDPVVAFKACYHNYIYFLSRFMNKLKEKHDTQDAEQSLLSAEDEKTRQWIAEHECGDLKSILAFRKIVHTAEELKNRAARQVFEEADKKTYSSLLQAKDEYDHGASRYESYVEADTESIRAQTEVLENQIAKMETEIKKAEALYQALNDVLSPEWFGKFLAKLEEIDCVDSIGSGMTCMDIKSFLGEMTSAVNEKILNAYPRI